MEYYKIYQRFLNLCSAIDELGKFPALQPYERSLLNKLNEYWLRKEPVTVLQVLDINNQHSRATTHKYLKNLHSKGYLVLAVDNNDNRFKQIRPTPMTYSYFNELGKSLVKASAEI